MTLTARFSEALLWAAELHADQRRKGSDTPYLAHVLAVASLVLEHGGDETEAIAALLHDAVEDQGGAATAARIAERFGPRVAEIVAGCTDTDQSPKPPWRARKESFLARLETAPAAVLRVTAADKLHNVRSLIVDYRSLGEALWPRFTGGREGTLWYYGAASEIVARRSPGPLADELQRAVDGLKAVVLSSRETEVRRVECNGSG